MNWTRIIYSNKKIVDQRIQLPSSKSISNRLLILQFLSKTKSSISDLSQANDTLVLKSILAEKEIPPIINCQDAGTALRFMTCLCATQNGKSFILEGTEQLMNRPMQPLIYCLTQLGADIKEDLIDDQKVIRIKGKALKSAPLKIAGNISSQFITALCLIASEIDGGLQLQIDEPIYSKPYIDITLKLLEHVGVQSTFVGNTVYIEQQAIQEFDLAVEADWSSACFFYALLIISDDFTSLKINKLNLNDVQGDKYIYQISEFFGIETIQHPTYIELNKGKEQTIPETKHLADYPDLAVPLLVACAVRYPQVQFTGLDHLKFKESNRIQALQANLENFGIQLHIENDAIRFEKSEKFSSEQPIKLRTYDDHRIAMCSTLLAALGRNIELDSIHCVAKSFPGFFVQMNKLGFSIEKSII